MSGLPLRPHKPASFERQLRLLAEGWRRRGVEASVLGPGEADGAQRDAPTLLLGYPEQFPFLAGAPAAAPLEAPLFLWAQCSRAPDPRAFGPACPVPLTGRTADFLAEAGFGRVGPVIPHAVDTVFFRPPEPGERARARAACGVQGRFCVLAVGAHTYRKRFDLILQALALLRARRPEAVLLLHTDRKVSLDGADLERQAARLQAAEGLLLSAGERPGEGLRELYWAADALVNLSEWEGFGLPVAEAMACGLPVVTHRGQGPGELVPYRELVAEDSRPYEEAGRRLLEASPATAARFLELAASDPELCRRLGEQGRRAMEARCALERVLAAWERLFRSGKE